MGDLRMDAYYYGFDETGVAEIDLILSAVACAGKAYHHTQDWNDETSPYEGHTGVTPALWIQNAAQQAADAISTLTRERDDFYMDYRIKCDEETKKAHAERDAAIARADDLEQRLWRALSLLREAEEWLDDNTPSDLTARIAAVTQTGEDND